MRPRCIKLNHDATPTQDNSVLYQVYLTEDARNYYAGAVLGLPGCTGGPYVYDCGIEGDRLMQSQLTTISHLDDGTVERVRTAQGELSYIFQ